MKHFKIAAILVFIAAIFFSHPAIAKIKAKGSVSTGNMDSQDTTNFKGSVTVPVKNKFNIQVDGLYSDAGDTDYKGAVGRLFWQDNRKALVAVNFGGVFGDSVDSYEASIQAEYYLPLLTLGTKGGSASIEYDDEAPFIDTDKNGLFGNFYINVYPIDNLLIAARVENRFNNTSFNMEVEYQLPIINGLSIYGSGMTGAHDYEQWFAGIRYYFGGGNTLKEHQRSNAPQNTAVDILSGIGSYGAEFNEAERDFTANQNVPPPNLNPDIPPVVPETPLIPLTAE